MRRVVILCFPEAELLDIAGPANVLTVASRFVAPDDGYQVELAAARPGPVRTAGGIELLARRSPRSLRGDLDTLLVPGAAFPAMERGLGLAPWVKRLAPRARRVAGVCGGAFVLGKAGLLSGRRAATHWAGVRKLRRHHPDCEVDPDAIFVHDRGVWTSAGVTAGMDLALSFVEADHGAAVALEVARWLVMYLRRPGNQSQFSAPLKALAADREPLRGLGSWIADRLGADLSVPVLARRVGMSERHFARVFAAELGTTPARYVERVRLEAARRELELGARPVKQIAGVCGFRNVETMHRAFRRTFGITPVEHRERFGRRRDGGNRQDDVRAPRRRRS